MMLTMLRIVVLLMAVYVAIVFSIFFGMSPEQYPDSKLFNPFAATMLFVAQPFLLKIVFFKK